MTFIIPILCLCIVLNRVPNIAILIAIVLLKQSNWTHSTICFLKMYIPSSLLELFR